MSVATRHAIFPAIQLRPLCLLVLLLCQGAVSNACRSEAAQARGVSVNEVCDACNTGWVRELEERVEPVLAPAIAVHGNTVFTSEAQRDTALRTR